MTATGRGPSNGAVIENRTFAEMEVGDTASITHTVTQQDIELFAFVSGDVNPAHLDPAYASTTLFRHIIAHGMISAGLISAVLGTKLPGPGTIYIAQSLSFRRPVSVGDTITATVTVTEKREIKQDVVLDCRCVNQRGQEVVTGRADVRAPVEKVRRPVAELPEVRVARHERYKELLARAADGVPVRTAVVYPCSAAALRAMTQARAAALIEPILIGPATVIEQVACESEIDISGLRIVDSANPRSAAEQAMALAVAGELEMLVQGSLGSDDLLAAVAASALRTARRLSHVYLLDVPGHPRLLLLTDAMVTVSPDLEAKRGIIQNAIDLARAAGIETPRVAVLSASETIDTKLASTTDAAVLSKMADRGQITGGLVDGPLTFDQAVSPQAAAGEGIASEVAGRADILVAPDLETGNLLAGQLTSLAGADAAGVVLGARVPIVLTSSGEGERVRLASFAVAVLQARARRKPASG